MVAASRRSWLPDRAQVVTMAPVAGEGRGRREHCDPNLVLQRRRDVGAVRLAVQWSRRLSFRCAPCHRRHPLNPSSTLAREVAES